MPANPQSPKRPPQRAAVFGLDGEQVAVAVAAVVKAPQQVQAPEHGQDLKWAVAPCRFENALHGQHLLAAPSPANSAWHRREPARKKIPAQEVKETIQEKEA